MLTENLDINDDPFTAFEFDGAKNNQPTTSNSAALDSSQKDTTVVQQPLEVPELPLDPYNVRGSVDGPPSETNQPSQTINLSTGSSSDKAIAKNWTTFDSDFGTLESGSTDVKKRSSMFEEPLSSKPITRSSDASTEQAVHTLKPPPRNRRRSSRPHTVYGEKSIKTDSQPQQSTPNKPRIDLASIKPKQETKDKGPPEDPFMDLFMRKPDGLVNGTTSTNNLEYTSTHF